MYIYIRVHVYIHTCKCMYIHIRVNVYIHTCTCMSSSFLSWRAEAETTVYLYDIKNLLSLLFLRSFILDCTVLPVTLQYSKGEKCSNISRRIALCTSDLTVYGQRQNFGQKGPKSKVDTIGKIIVMEISCTLGVTQNRDFIIKSGHPTGSRTRAK